MKRYISILAVVAMVFSMSSCYKIFSTSAPKEVMPGETFQVTMTVVDDGNDQQKFMKDWSLAGVRVPVDWEVAAPAMNHQQFAEDWVYYEDGTKVAKRDNMQRNDNLTKMYNDACKKEGYVWHAYQSRKMIPKFISACWRNGCDSIRVTFNVTVPEGTAPGKYSIDFIGGDEEDEAGVDKYTSYTQAVGTRAFHVGTFNYANFEHSHPEHSLTVEVIADPTAITEVNTDDAENAPIYTIDGKRIPKLQKGLNIIGGKKVLK